MTQFLRNGLQVFGRYAIQQSIVLPLVLVFVIAMLVVSPVGEFPLNDDWIYSKTVQQLLATGHYQAHPYLNATLVAQAYWGALFCKIFGFSFTTLRASTLVLALINAWAVAQCALTMGLKRNLALLCAVMVATSPLVLQLSYSFMTDIPFLAMSSLSGLFFLKALKQPNPQWVVWGSSFAVLAFLVRQFGILLPLAFGLVSVWLTARKNYVFSRAMQVAMLAPWSVVLGMYLIWGKALISRTPILEVSNAVYGTVIEGVRYGPVALCYMGLFTLPLGIGRLWQILRKRGGWSKNRWFVFLGFCCCSLFIFGLPQLLYWLKRLVFHNEALWLKNYPSRMPLMVYKTLLDLGLGPLQLPDPQPTTTLQVHDWWWPITLAALAVAGVLFLTLIDHWQATYQAFGPLLATDRNQDCFLVVWGILSLAAAYNPLRMVTLDRYFLPALVPLVLLLARDLARHQPNATKLVVLCTLFMGLFSLMSLQDYWVWNQTAWVAHHKLERVYQAPSAAVKGIHTFNGWYNSDAYMARHRTQSWWHMNVDGKGPWVLGDQYVIASVEPRPGYQVLERIPYFSWLGWRERNIIIFKRLDN